MAMSTSMKMFIRISLAVSCMACFMSGVAAAAGMEMGSANNNDDSGLSSKDICNEGELSPLVRLKPDEVRDRGGHVSRDVAAGVGLLQDAADTGYSAALFVQGLNYLYGKGVLKDVAKAKKILSESAAGRDFRAETYLKILKNGSRGEIRDRKMMSDSVRKWAARNNPDAMYALAIMHNSGEGVPKDAGRAIRLFRAAAAKGNARAGFRLALMYYYGESVKRDTGLAAGFAKAAAERRHVSAMYFLGTLYYRGIGVQTDKAKSTYWFRKSAEQGHVEAQYALGLLLLSGEGVAADQLEAIKWLDNAARKGSDGARAVLRELVAFKGEPLDEPTLRLGIKETYSKAPPTAKEISTRIEGKGVSLENGNFSLRFSGPDLNDTDTRPRVQTTSEADFWSRLKCGRIEVIFRQ